jgi:acyl transferase domain-containing protein
VLHVMAAISNAAERAASQMLHAAPEPIAIVGLGALLPGASNVQQFWANTLAGRSAIAVVPDAVWQPALYYEADLGSERPDKTYSRLAAVVGDVPFVPKEFGLSPAASRDMDITQKVALLVAREALTDAGIAAPVEDLNAAVIFGNLMGGVQARSERVFFTAHAALEHTLAKLPTFAELPAARRNALLAELRASWSDQFGPNTGYSLAGALGNIIAARIAHFWNFRGPALTVDAACASGLAAVELAVLGLRARRFDMALTGGVDFVMDPTAYVGFSLMGALSDTGSFPFDARANGFIMGEGAAAFVLKRLCDVNPDRDRVYATILGVGSASDGRTHSVVLPDQRGQVRAIRAAYVDADCDPLAVGFVEAHGTSTPIGDPLEIAAMRVVFGQAGPRLALGSSKANVGHLKGAAGAVGLLRATLACAHGVIPPQANYAQPNPRCKFERTRFYVPTEAEPWGKRPDRAGVSSFGFGGINYHAVLARPSASPVEQVMAATAAPLQLAAMTQKRPPQVDADPPQAPRHS